MGFAPKNVFHQHGHQGPAEPITGENRENYSQRHWREKKFGGANQEDDGNKHDTNGQGGYQSWHSYLTRAFQNRFAQVESQLTMPVDVFNRNGGFIHENADGQSKASQGHHIEGVTHGTQQTQRSHHTQRNGDGHNQRAAPASQKQQDQSSREGGGNQSFFHHAIKSRLNKERLVGEQVNLHPRRRGSLQLGQLSFHRFDDIQGGAVAIFKDLNEHRAFAICPH